MTVHGAAYHILREEKKPLLPDEVAQRILDEGMKSSRAKDPVHSFATTITKTIREDNYNSPELVFFRGPQGRMVGLPEWKSDGSQDSDSVTERMSFKISSELIKKIRLAGQAGFGDSLDKTIALVLKKGLSSIAPEIKERIGRQLDDLDDQ